MNRSQIRNLIYELYLLLPMFFAPPLVIQVRACTDFGCGNWSTSVKTNFVEEFPIPKLLVTTNEGLIKMDYDRRSFSMTIPDTENAKDTTYDADSNAIYWIEDKSICQSYLDVHLTNIKKVCTFGISSAKEESSPKVIARRFVLLLSARCTERRRRSSELRLVSQTVILGREEWNLLDHQ